MILGQILTALNLVAFPGALIAATSDLQDIQASTKGIESYSFDLISDLHRMHILQEYLVNARTVDRIDHYVRRGICRK